MIENILISILFSLPIIFFFIVCKRMNKLDNKIKTVYETMRINRDYLLNKMMTLEISLDCYIKIWRTQMRPDTKMMQAQNISITENYDATEERKV